MNKLKFAVIGCGPAAQVHLAAWREIPGAELIAVCDLDLARAQAAAAQFGVKAFADAAQLFEAEMLDFVDLAVPVDAHAPLIELAATHKKHVICETPFASSVAEGKALNALCRDAGVRLMVHESMRFQPAMRAVKAALLQPRPGKLYQGRIAFRAPAALIHARPGSETQEHLALNRFGLHLLDLARYYFGEVKGLYCQTQTLGANLKGEDVAVVMLRFASGATCIVDVNVASETDPVPTTSMRLECEHGFIELGADFALTKNIGGSIETASAASSIASTVTPFHGLPFAWNAHFAATVGIQTHWIEALNANAPPETSAADNLRSLALLIGAYESARTRQVFTP